jgi:hypothetical protein
LNEPIRIELTPEASDLAPYGIEAVSEGFCPQCGSALHPTGTGWSACQGAKCGMHWQITDDGVSGLWFP